jgi:hypothetical protein
VHREAAEEGVFRRRGTRYCIVAAQEAPWPAGSDGGVHHKRGVNAPLAVMLGSTHQCSADRRILMSGHSPR